MARSEWALFARRRTTSPFQESSPLASLQIGLSMMSCVESASGEVAPPGAAGRFLPLAGFARRVRCDGLFLRFDMMLPMLIAGFGDERRCRAEAREKSARKILPLLLIEN